MNGTGIVFVGGGKGGVGKSATSHLAAQESDTASEVEQQRLERTERLKNPE